MIDLKYLNEPEGIKAEPTLEGTPLMEAAKKAEAEKIQPNFCAGQDITVEDKKGIVQKAEGVVKFSQKTGIFLSMGSL
jgi:hypothetical protein